MPELNCCEMTIRYLDMEFLHRPGTKVFRFFSQRQAERGFAAWAVFVGRTVVFVRGKGNGA